MNVNGILFGVLSLKQEEIEGKRVLEVGSCNVNGSLRPFVESLHPGEYVGVDIVPGPCVDAICQAGDLVKRFGADRFDVVISAEMLEHIRDWKQAVHNMKNVCAPGGVILVTTRSRGFLYHGYPCDFWRYEPEDMKEIFADYAVESIQRDPDKGVFVKARKPAVFAERDLSAIELYSIIAGKRMKTLTDDDLSRLSMRSAALRAKLKDSMHKWINRIFGI